MKIETETFRDSASHIGRKAAVDFARRWWCALALPFFGALIASILDWRWIVAALAIVLVAYPFILMMAFYSRALTPQAAKALFPKKAEITDAGIEIAYFPIDESSPAPSPEYIPLPEISGCEDCGESLEIRHSHGVLSIPASALSRQDTAELLQFFSDLK